MHTDATVHSRATPLAFDPYTTDTTTSPRERAHALWCLLSHSGTTPSARTKSSATSEVLGKLAGGLRGGARQIGKKNAYQGWIARQHAGCTAARGRAHGQAERCGWDGSARAHLQALRALLVLNAAGACRCATAAAGMPFISKRPSKCCFLSGTRRQKVVCRRRTKRDAHTCDRLAWPEP